MTKEGIFEAFEEFANRLLENHRSGDESKQLHQENYLKLFLKKPMKFVKYFLNY